MGSAPCGSHLPSPPPLPDCQDKGLSRAFRLIHGNTRFQILGQAGAGTRTGTGLEPELDQTGSGYLPVGLEPDQTGTIPEWTGTRTRTGPGPDWGQNQTGQTVKLGAPIKVFCRPWAISQIGAADYVLNFWGWGWGGFFGRLTEPNRTELGIP